MFLASIFIDCILYCRISLILAGKTFDVGTPDPFLNDKKWITMKVKNELCEKTYEFLESCITQL